MNRKIFCLRLLPILISLPLAAQDAPKVEVLGDFSLLRANPAVTGLKSYTVYGGGGGVTFFLNRYFGIASEFQGYGSTTITTTLTDGQIANVPAGSYTTQSNYFTYLFGPQVKVRTGRVQPFGEILFGGSQSNLYANFKCTNCANQVNFNVPSQHPFTMAFGGGVDVVVSPHIALRLGQFDWLLTRYTNPLTYTNNQNNFRYQAGIIFSFGGK